MDYYPPGIPDELFIRGAVPMTKAEVRAVTMSKARLRDAMRVLDIGGGTGSFTIEAALLCPLGEVVVVERDPEALELLRRNIAHFNVSNVTVVEGEAPDVLKGMARFDRIFLGGSGGRMSDLLHLLPTLLTPGGRVVSNTIGIESTNEIITHFRRAPWQHWEIVQISVARGVPVWDTLTRFDAQNPVWIAAAEL